MELWLTKSKSANVTKANLIQKYAGMEGIIRQFKKYHDMARDVDEPCDFQTLESTFSDIMAKSHARQISLGLKPDVPTAVSRGWFSDMKIKIGIKDSAVASAEVRRLTITDEKVFWDGYKEKAIKHNIQITNVFSFDEFNDLFCRTPKRVQTSAKERLMPTGKRVKRTGNGRITLTACVLFSPLRKGKMLFLLFFYEEVRQRNAKTYQGGFWRGFDSCMWRRQVCQRINPCQVCAGRVGR